MPRIVRDDDGVVHEHAHGDDESRERRAVEALAQELHEQQRAADREEQRRADQHARAEAHDEHDDRDDDGHRLGQVEHEGRVGLAGDAVLGIEHREFEPHGHAPLQRIERTAHGRPHLHHVGIGLGGDADAHGRPPPDVHDRGRRLGIAPLHAGHVAQAVLLALGGHEQLVGDVVGRAVHAVFEDAHAQRAGLLLAAVGDRVAPGDGLHDRLGPDGEIGERGQADLHVHHGALLAVERDLLHARHGHQRTFDPLRPVAQLRPRVTRIGRQGVVDAVDVAEVVGHGDGRGARREARRDVEHLAAQLVPALGNLARRGGRVEFDQDFRDSVVGLGGDFPHVAHRLHLAADGFGDELLHLKGRSARIGADERRALDDEGGVFLLAEAHEARRAAQEQHGEEEPDDLRIAKRIFGQIHGRIIGGSVLSRRA